jgi:hypothetical protein
MKVQVLEKILKAQAILNLLEFEFDTNNLYVENYANGREQGYHLRLWRKDKALTFSEYRNTDQWVVYIGKPADFNNGTPNEKVYAEKKFFGCYDYNELINFIQDYFEKE